MKWRKSWSLLSTTALLAAWLVACNPPKKNEGEDCKTNFDCVTDLVCIQNKCQKAEVKPEGKKPQAAITGALRVKVGENATLSGTSSLFYSASPKPKYTWGLASKPDGSSASLSDTGASQVTIKPDVPGSYKLSLKVADDTLESDVVEVTLEAFKDNVPPEAKVTPAEATVKAGEAVALDGSTSTDADNDTLTYAWSFRSKPDGSQATLQDADKDKASFTPDAGGLYAVELKVTDGKGGEGSVIAYITATKEAPAPTLTMLSPNTGVVGATVNFDLEGTGFLYGAKVSFDGADLTGTEYVSATRLRAKVDLTGKSAGKVKVKVVNPDSKETSEMEFEILEGQKPTISYVGPALVIAGQIVNLTVQGTNFVRGATIKFDGNDLKTEYGSDTSVSGVLTVPNDGEYDVIVTNPDGKASDPYKFRVSSVSALVDGISFSTIGKDCASETIVINGRNMLSGVKVELVDANDATKTFAPIKLTYTNMTEVRVEYDFTQLMPGAYKLKVTNAGSTNPAEVDFTVTETTPTPSLLSVHPRRMFIGAKAKGYLVAMFLEGAKLTLDGNPITPTKINDTLYEIDVDGSALTAAKKLEVSAVGLCQKSSNKEEVDAIEIPIPTVTQIAPNPVPPGAPNIVIRGEGFHPNATVTVDGAAAMVTYVNSNMLTIDGTSYTTKKTYKLIVTNPGMKASAEASFDVDEFMKIASVPPDEEYFLRVCGSNLQNTGSDPAPEIELLKSGTSVVKKTAANAIGYAGGCIGTTRSSFTGLTSGEIYDLRVCRKVAGTDVCSATVPWTNKAKATPAALKVDTVFMIAKSSWNTIYICGENLRAESSGLSENPAARFYQNGTLVGEVNYNDNYSFFYASSGDYQGCVYFDDDDSDLPSGLIAGQTYDVEGCRDIGGSTVCSSNRVTWTWAVGPAPGAPTSGSGSTEPNFPPAIQGIEPTSPATFVVDAQAPPAKVTFKIRGINFSTTKTKVYINNVDISTLAGVTVTPTASEIEVKDYPITLGTNTRLELPIEVTNDKGRSNTTFLDINTTQRVRVLWVESMIIPIDASSLTFYLWGYDFATTHKILDGAGNPIKSGTSDLSFSSSSKAPYFLQSSSWSSSNFNTLTPGLAPVQLESATGVKSNTVKLRVIGPGQWGTEELSIVSVYDGTGSAGAGNAPVVGEDTTLRVAVTGYDPGGGLGAPGEILVDGMPRKVEKSSTVLNGYTYFELEKVSFSKSGIVPVVLKNPSGVQSVPRFLSVTNGEGVRITRVVPSYTTGHYFTRIIRPGQINNMYVYGKNIASDDKVFLAGIPQKVTSNYTSSTYDYLRVDFDGADLPDGTYPVWVESKGRRSNTILVDVIRNGINPNAAPRLYTVIPASVSKGALTSLNSKMRIAIAGEGFRENYMVNFNGQKLPVIFYSSQLVFVELDLSAVAAGNHPVSVEDATGKVKSFELELVVE
ncbi:MAG: IPT/TIG domain-containing protein [Myxococcales bacterium]|nr:IPT/TIG domain-containing protein [Myxococcales bacterium]